ncbi:hypothetical protein P689_122312 [Candidatus Riesia pediculischaeffi PTSU]|uniref:Uncharacterized protein n=1 Tax=Candidatus Riesia pediculischaeffi PTSU TaxID=1401651 RepID=A0A0C1VJ38_9ENTR|nr:hypothetical protein P689_122312 [Candidatus Riesia pediculischaeffi PTSU]
MPISIISIDSAPTLCDKTKECSIHINYRRNGLKIFYTLLG